MLIFFGANDSWRFTTASAWWSYHPTASFGSGLDSSADMIPKVLYQESPALSSRSRIA